MKLKFGEIDGRFSLTSLQMEVLGWCSGRAPRLFLSSFEVITAPEDTEHPLVADT